MAIEAVFMLNNKILDKRLVEEELMFSSYRRGRTLWIKGKKVVVRQVSRVDDAYLTECEVHLMEG